MRLTGRTRHRSERSWGKERLVLQVEETWVHSQDLGGSGYYDDETRVQWRDATTADLTLIPARTP